MEHDKIDYDREAPNAKRLIVFILSLVVFLAIIMGGIFYLSKTNKDNAEIKGLSNLGIPYEVEQLRKYEHRLLNEYGVVDADKGIYRIPIEEAMNKVIRDYR